MFLGGQKLRPYIPMAKARGFTGAIDNMKKLIMDGNERFLGIHRSKIAISVAGFTKSPLLFSLPFSVAETGI